MKQQLISYLGIVMMFLTVSCKDNPDYLDTEKYLDFARQQVARSLEAQEDIHMMPRFIPLGEINWHMVPVRDWTSGFWPGILWHMAEYTGEEFWLNAAAERSMPLVNIFNDYKDHDLGFQFYCSFGHGLRLTGNPEYADILLQAADSLCAMYNPTVGTIRSWPWARTRYKSPHNTIIDNMMNLELLFWAARATGDSEYYDLSVKHAITTMNNHLREDFSSYHVLAYDMETGQAIQKVTNQGFADESMWARGQAWGIYGFTMAYRETGKKEFLIAAQNMAKTFIDRLPEDYVPYWDFDAPVTQNTPRDASAAAITASALLELSTLMDDPGSSAYYRNMGNRILRSLSENYLSDGSNNAVLNRSVGNMPVNSEIDVSIIYADYYYIEALMRERALQKN
jgi:unsaturated chondroitin disaccharide hydrolase